jgi:hypothetical protein
LEGLWRTSTNFNICMFKTVLTVSEWGLKFWSLEFSICPPKADFRCASISDFDIVDLPKEDSDLAFEQHAHRD